MSNATAESPVSPSEHRGSAAHSRRQALAVLAEGNRQQLASLVAGIGSLPLHRDVRAPESGLVMVRGRISGDGPPFNIGEATVTRAAVQLETGEIGFGYVLGRDGEQARLIALCDALLQSEPFRAKVEADVLEPLRARTAEARRSTAEQTAATRVEFFTLVRGEDER
jgi:alpha-D-ribose 1-methylphosphonate 5-triphosphate synthase subunit PhnG